MENASLRVDSLAGDHQRASGSVEVTRPALALTSAQQQVVAAQSAVVVAIGPPSSGKTTALAARAMVVRKSGGDPLIVCSHESSCQAFREALTRLSSADDDVRSYRIGTLAEHAARWLCSAYLAAGVAPQIGIGGKGATRRILEEAAKGLLDMSWPMFARSDINLDLPHLSRPEVFLDEAASLFSLLQRSRITPEEFEEGCAAGIAAFYGEQTERAVVLLQDHAVRKRASGRGRDACRASAESLAAQRRAERDTAAILGQLYRHYRIAAAGAASRSAEDLIDAAARWLSADEGAAQAIAAGIDAFIVDDAEDAEPGLPALVQILRRRRAFPLILAGHEASRVDGFEGRRSALASFSGAERIKLPPLVPPPTAQLRRFEDEAAEADWLARQIGDLLRDGARPERIALVSRTEQAAARYAKLLQERGVPAAMPRGMLEREGEIADLLALAALIDDPMDQEHLLRVLSSPLVGLSDESLWILCRDPAERQQLALDVGASGPARPSATPKPDTLARNFQNGGADAALPEATRATITVLRDDVTRWRADCCHMSALQRLVYLADAAGFRDRWLAAPASQAKRLLEDLRRVAHAVSQAAAVGGSRSFDAIARLMEEEVVALPPAEHVTGAVVTDSIVAVKGMRFDHVFVAGVAHERFPRIYTSHAMAFSRTYGLIVRENIAHGAAQTAKFAWYYAKFGAKAMYLDEERRALAYGLARALVSATASGFGTPPYWAREHDLLAGLENGAAQEAPDSQ